jgi:hypothetical protein
VQSDAGIISRLGSQFACAELRALGPPLFVDGALTLKVPSAKCASSIRRSHELISPFRRRAVQESRGQNRGANRQSIGRVPHTDAGRTDGSGLHYSVSSADDGLLFAGDRIRSLRLRA